MNGVALSAVLIVAVASASGQELPEDVLTLARTMNTNRDLLKRIPLYTCLETMDRRRPKERGHPSSHDVVQVDVGVSDGDEMYSWPGDTTFSSLGLFDLVVNGMLSTGMFSGFAHNVFVGQHGIVRFAGKATINGRDAFHFTYTVPSLDNRWKMDWNGMHGDLLESGEFWVDARDFHLERLHVTGHEIPAEMMLKSLDLVVTYDLVQGDRTPTLLATEGALTVVDDRGKTYYNTVAFSHCHVFQAESKMSTSDVDVTVLLTRYKQQRGTLPPGMRLRIALTDPIVAKTARVGDVLSARLESQVRVSPDVLIPAGAILKGRLRQFADQEDPPNTYIVGLEFTELQWGDKSYRFFAELSGMEELPGISSETVGEGEPMRDVMAGTATMTRNEVGTTNKIPGAAVFYLSGRSGVPKGFQMSWKTLAVRRH